MTEAILIRLTEAYKFGCTQEEACLHAGIQETEYEELLAENESLEKQFQQFRLTPLLIARKTLVQVLEKDAKIAFDFLKHKLPNEFKNKSEEGRNSAEVQAELTPEQVECIIHFLKTSS